MKFVKTGEMVELAFKAHNSSNHQTPLLQVVNHDGTELYRKYMDHTPDQNTADGLYTATFRAPETPTYLACLVDEVGQGTIMVGTPDHAKIFYYDPRPASLQYTFVTADTRRLLQQGTMESIGNNLYVITTALDGEVILIAGKREGEMIMLPFKPEGAPVRPVHIRAQRHGATTQNWEMD